LKSWKQAKFQLQQRKQFYPGKLGKTTAPAAIPILWKDFLKLIPGNVLVLTKPDDDAFLPTGLH
jgi:hypothetical protein